MLAWRIWHPKDCKTSEPHIQPCILRSALLSCPTIIKVCPFWPTTHISTTTNNLQDRNRVRRHSQLSKRPIVIICVRWRKMQPCKDSQVLALLYGLFSQSTAFQSSLLVPDYVYGGMCSSTWVFRQNFAKSLFGIQQKFLDRHLTLFGTSWHYKRQPQLPEDSFRHGKLLILNDPVLGQPPGNGVVVGLAGNPKFIKLRITSVRT